MNQLESRYDSHLDDHLDEMTCLLYLEGQLDRDRARRVSAHTEDCSACRTLLRALEWESRLLTRAMAEEDESLTARLLAVPGRRVRSMEWVWAAAFGLAATGVYALYAGYIEPWQEQLNQAGFGGTNLFSLLIFQGAFWKGWQSMISLIEMLVLLTLAGGAVVFLRRRLCRTSASALVFGGLLAALALPAAAPAAEIRKADEVAVGKEETVKNDLIASGARVRVDGAIEGDLIVFAAEVEVRGHVTGDVIAFARSLRVSGQVDGNVRAFTNELAISGVISRNVSSFTATHTLDPSGKIGGSLTAFADSLSLDGAVGRDLLSFAGHTSLNGAIGGNARMMGERLSVGSSARIDGKANFRGAKEPSVSPQAKLASPIEFTKVKHGPDYTSPHFIVWRTIWTAATLLFGMVFFLLLPQFARDTVGSAERYGASFGLGVLVLFGVPIAAVIACLTIVGIPLGISAVVLWLAALYSSQIIVGAVVGKWVLGPAGDTWALIARMALGMVLVRLCFTVPYAGVLVKLAVLLWGIGAISLALYKRLQPIVSAAPSSSALGGAEAM